MGILFLANFMNLIDVTIVNVALPAIQNDLGASATQLEWIVAIYILAFAAGLLPFGRFGDVFGRKKLFLIGLTGFTLSSLACGMASSIDELIIARGVQGLSGAMMVPQVLAIIHVIFPPAEKGRVFGLFGAITSLGGVAGPVIGGALISANLGGLDWRPIFLINIPFGIVVLIGALRWLPAMPIDKSQRPDWIGAALLAISVTLLVLPLIEGHKLDWPVWCIISIGSAFITAILFVRWQNYRAKNGQAQLLPASLLKCRPYMTGIVLVTLFFSGIPGFFLTFAIFLQSGFGMSAYQAGITTAPFPLGIMITSMLAGKFKNKWLSQRITGGAFLAAIGLIALQFIFNNIENDINVALFTAPLLVCGIGMGFAIAPLFQSVLANVETTNAGAGSGAMQAFHQIGGVIGIAIIGHLFFATLGEIPTTNDYMKAIMAACWYPTLAFAIVCLSQISDFNRKA